MDTMASEGFASQPLSVAGPSPERAIIRLLVVDDHPVVREGIKAMLATDAEIEVVGEASSAGEALQAVEQLRPDVVLMDIRMPDMDGLEATRRIKESHAEVAVVMLTIYDHDAYVIEAVKAGAVGYLMKDASRELLVYTLKAARSGGALVKSSLLRAAMDRFGEGRMDRFGEGREEDGGPGQPPVRPGSPIRGPGAPAPALPTPFSRGTPKGLTPRELEVVGLVAQGKTNKEIGQALHIAELTVKKHVASILDKLGVRNRSGAAAWAVQAGLLR